MVRIGELLEQAERHRAQTPAAASQQADPLRIRDDFKKLLAELEAKQK